MKILAASAFLMCGCSSIAIGGSARPATIAGCTSGKPAATQPVGTRCFRAASAVIGTPAQAIVVSSDVEATAPVRAAIDFRAPALRFVRAAPRTDATPRIPYGLHWSLTSAGFHFLHWTDGYVGGTMCLNEAEGGLNGEITEYSCTGTSAPEPIFLSEVPCDGEQANSIPDP
jgi:hypothetical protein